MGKMVTGWEDHGTYLRVYADVPYRRNGLPNLAAARAAQSLLDQISPDAYDPVEPLTEEMARAAIRDFAAPPGSVRRSDGEWVQPPNIPQIDDDEIPGYRCANGACTGD